uniref:Uncharacterized protein n=1 Tax=Glossina brevipalpis TaxID=37001 RepID=A0A1A9WLP1_9MUSC
MACYRPHLRKKRYLLFEKSAAVTFQGFVGKSIVSGTPRGLNQIVEYTLMYELPTDLQLFKTERVRTTIAPIITTTITPTTESYFITIPPYHPSFHKHKNYYYYEGGSRRNWSPIPLKNIKRFKHNLHEYVNNDSINTNNTNECQDRIKKENKRLQQRQLKFDNAEQRMLYDILEQWSLIERLCRRLIWAAISSVRCLVVRRKKLLSLTENDEPNGKDMKRLLRVNTVPSLVTL